MVGLAFLIGYIGDELKPKEYYYKNKIVIVDKKYRCPAHCAVNHNHYVLLNQIPQDSLLRVPKKHRKLK
jgi:hypothetical protein